ncbi:hypothetical protein BX616_006446 [Lobosporangium transversale]|uniref:Methylated-DNA--protein-cysteine methyltransferase n=1 Tax=Lobosporangium transversale TaxID=64571 RepID=A0A1Y2GJ98_9FUNG|nr:6-O-methylguanine DNA methyltransferase [Lobosporangium transversale]KAF9896954.1 hypothetical protein BX616_006446 [Lobosporangium transversale]ORZ09061.1 6-O-methylguanine DNA methyltransferase [Lobosporangium transversale]|eukprot:XP_021878688.1 6-O-methylguanine DNA methyltransferase [Lobosporangium transversale]
MPAERTMKRTASTAAAANVKEKKPEGASTNMKKAPRPAVMDDDVCTVHLYPNTAKERENAINKHTGRKITPFQFQVYDLCAQIPKGQISTYKHISDALQSSSRAVGQALKVNPFAPLPIPCHRVLDSKLYIGGFMGQWGEGEKIDNKRAKLFHEGIVFDETDHVAQEIREKVIFTDFTVPEKSTINVTAAVAVTTTPMCL